LHRSFNSEKGTQFVDDVNVRPISEPIHLSGVWEMDSIEQADALMAGKASGFIYRRDGHPNAKSLEETLRAWHGADHAVTTAQGMSAFSAAMLALLAPGDEVLLGQPLYGKTSYLVKKELSRWGVLSREVPLLDENAWAQALRPSVKMVIIESMTNPTLSVPDMEVICQIVKAYRSEIVVMVDNTFATPVLCQPLFFGADLVMESLSKFACGHGDVMLGLLAGKESVWSRIRSVVSTFGLASSPMDCWLTTRGLATLPVRMHHAANVASNLARRLEHHPAIARVDYPGLEGNPSHERAKRMLKGSFGNMVTIHLHGGHDAASRFIHSVRESVPFCPSLGDAKTTLSHPASTSHRSFSADELSRIGVDAGTIRLSCGLEDPDRLCNDIQRALS
jgi:cystathionine beta-lyase/cystathionine gamma-synthase